MNRILSLIGIATIVYLLARFTPFWRMVNKLSGVQKGIELAQPAINQINEARSTANNSANVQINQNNQPQPEQSSEKFYGLKTEGSFNLPIGKLRSGFDIGVVPNSNPNRQIQSWMKKGCAGAINSDARLDFNAYTGLISGGESGNLPAPFCKDSTGNNIYIPDWLIDKQIRFKVTPNGSTQFFR